MNFENYYKIKNTIWDDCFIFRIIESGNVKVKAKKEEHVLTAGSILLSHFTEKITEIVEFESVIEQKYLILVIRDEYLKKISNDYTFQKMISQLSGKNSIQQNNILKDIPINSKEIIKMLILYEKYQNKDLLIYAKIHELIYLLSNLFTTQNIIKKTDNFLTDVIDIINEEHSNPDLLDILPQKFFINKVDFRRRFKDGIGMGTHEYIKKIRMEKAYDLLLDGNSKVFEISESVGYKSYGYFSKIFYEHFGIFPKDVKKHTP
ncbi:MAG: helix-turn-helix transcriptional regulator [Sebaldella sp.]|nr:helix-turn-helix transcriptional regulator [Sebaldella sp.]